MGNKRTNIHFVSRVLEDLVHILSEPIAHLLLKINLNSSNFFFRPCTTLKTFFRNECVLAISTRNKQTLQLPRAMFKVLRCDSFDVKQTNALASKSKQQVKVQPLEMSNTSLFKNNQQIRDFLPQTMKLWFLHCT